MFQPAALAAFLGAETVLGCAIRELVVGGFCAQRSTGGEILVTPQKGGPPRKLVRLSERPRPCESTISDAHTSQCIVSKQDASGVWQNPSCRTGSLTGRQNLGFPLKEQHVRLEAVNRNNPAVHGALFPVSGLSSTM